MKAFYTMVGTETEATDLVETLLEEQLIACANLIETRSFYRWEGQDHDEDEYLLLMKTTASCWENCRDRLDDLHPYDVPAIIELDAEANGAYAEWVDTQVRD
ncbi:MAG: divalent-cation tolerance protein CutA [Candidatus Nanohaloarchaeota archaeon QJJ-5]|nr:divalent-cation tolerance protein CutA [Candidatus Nanohaloarchaeota archaeon QJJ-5]